MLFMVGIEAPKNETEAWGITVPVFEKFGLGCVSAVDDEKDILTEARDVILSMAEVALEQGILLDDLAEPYHDYGQHEGFEHFTRWVALDVDLSAISDEPKRVNISLSSALLARIDAVVDTNRALYKDRSYFLSVAASREIQQLRQA